jgi:hypothetical protein
MKLQIFNLILGIINILILGFVLYYIHSSQTPVQTNNIIYINQSCEDKNTILDKIQEVAYNNANAREYVLWKYDCTDFSKDLVKELNKTLNISAYCVFGETIPREGYYLHTWVEVNLSGRIIPIEATNGEVLINETGYYDDYYKENYKILKRGLCL